MKTEMKLILELAQASIKIFQERKASMNQNLIVHHLGIKSTFSHTRHPPKKRKVEKAKNQRT